MLRLIEKINKKDAVRSIKMCINNQALLVAVVNFNNFALWISFLDQEDR